MWIEAYRNTVFDAQKNCVFATQIHRSRGMLQCEARSARILSLSHSAPPSGTGFPWTPPFTNLWSVGCVGHLEDQCVTDVFPAIQNTWWWLLLDASNLPTVSMTGANIKCVACSRNTTCEYHWISAVCSIEVLFLWVMAFPDLTFFQCLRLP